MSNPCIIISLLNWMNFQDTIGCVESLLKLNYSNFFIIIRDNASPNDSFNQLQLKFPDLKIVRSRENNGFAAGHYENYILAKELGADLFWILNSDLEVASNTLSELVKSYLEHEDNIYGSVSLNTKNPELIDFGGSPYNYKSDTKLTYNSWKHKSYKNLIQLHPDSYEVESVEGSSMMIPMKVIEKYGFMKLDFFMYGEETDYCYRLRKAGIKSYAVTNSIVYHHNEGSTKLSPNLKIVTIYYRRRNALRFSMENFGMSRWNALSYQNSSYQNLKTVLKGLFSKKKEFHYFYALGCLHAFLGIKGKVIHPEKLLD